MDARGRFAVALLLATAGPAAARETLVPLAPDHDVKCLDEAGARAVLPDRPGATGACLFRRSEGGYAFQLTFGSGTAQEQHRAPLTDAQADDLLARAKAWIASRPAAQPALPVTDVEAVSP